MSPDPGRPRVAACLYVRDEAADIAEWLAFHHVVGVDHILVFDNGSKDGTRAVVGHAARVASITLLPWPVRDRRAQLWAYAVGLRLLRTVRLGRLSGLRRVPHADRERRAAGGARRLAGCGRRRGELGDLRLLRARRRAGGFGDRRLPPPGARRLRGEPGGEVDRASERGSPADPHTFAVRGAYVRPDGSAGDVRPARLHRRRTRLRPASSLALFHPLARALAAQDGARLPRHRAAARGLRAVRPQRGGGPLHRPLRPRRRGRTRPSRPVA